MRQTLTFDSEPYKSQQNSSLRDTRTMQDEIRRRAYELYEKRGRRDGQHEDDWLRAENELRNQYRLHEAA
jgi:Protein of unknown function (DUF2934)